jgi:glycosyltransferase involved in cell wall biosynthesis
VLAAALQQLSAEGGALHGLAWRWVLVGAGPFRPAIEQAIDKAGIGAHVRLVGAAPDAELHAWYEAATIFVHPTRYEGSSLVTLEAMAHRRPVIATRAGGLPGQDSPRPQRLARRARRRRRAGGSDPRCRRPRGRGCPTWA